jgi:hypothetical protein
MGAQTGAGRYASVATGEIIERRQRAERRQWPRPAGTSRDHLESLKGTLAHLNGPVPGLTAGHVARTKTFRPGR